MATHPRIDDHKGVMNQLSEMSGTVSTIVFAFVGVLIAGVAIDLYAQHVSRRRPSRVMNRKPESY